MAVLIDYWKLPFGCLQPSFSLVGERRFGIFGEFLFDWVRPPPKVFLAIAVTEMRCSGIPVMMGALPISVLRV